MLYQLRDKFNRLKFSLACNGIYSTPPVIATTDAPIAVLTQLQHKDVLLFLIAIKSFAKKIAINKVIVISDGSLTLSDINKIKKHIPIAIIHHTTEFENDKCPKGGCWERLLAIAHFNKDYYIIQLDSDTLTISDIPEIRKNIQASIGFVIGTWDNQEIEPMSVCAKRVLDNVSITPDTHVQMAAEANFLGLKNVDQLCYVRGCAGFAGFPIKSFEKPFIIKLSQEMEQLIGKKWHKWGSEQVMSNIVIANLEKKTVLPHPKYSDCIKMKTDITCFIHFIGECRFKTSTYSKMAKQIISTLRHS